MKLYIRRSVTSNMWVVSSWDGESNWPRDIFYVNMNGTLIKWAPPWTGREWEYATFPTEKSARSAHNTYLDRQAKK